MKPIAQRSPSQILRSRAIGARVGSLIGVAWLAFGVSLLGNSARVPIAIIGVVIAAVLLQRARRLIAASHQLPAPDEMQKRANRTVWMKFWINFVFEIVLLNVAINLLAAPAQQVYWVPAISLVVGLHFLPMARFMNVPSYWLCGVALMLGAAASATAIAMSVTAPTLLVSLESIFNAMVLWATAAWAVRAVAAPGNDSTHA